MKESKLLLFVAPLTLSGRLVYDSVGETFFFLSSWFKAAVFPLFPPHLFVRDIVLSFLLLAAGVRLVPYQRDLG